MEVIVWTVAKSYPWVSKEDEGSIVQHNTNLPKNVENQKINHIKTTFLKIFLSQEYLFEIRPKKFMVWKCKLYTKLTQDAYFENGKLMIGYIINSVALSVKNWQINF